MRAFLVAVTSFIIFSASCQTKTESNASHSKSEKMENNYTKSEE